MLTDHHLVMGAEVTGVAVSLLGDGQQVMDRPGKRDGGDGQGRFVGDDAWREHGRQPEGDLDPQ